MWRGLAIAVFLAATVPAASARATPPLPVPRPAEAAAPASPTIAAYIELRKLAETGAWHDLSRRADAAATAGEPVIAKLATWLRLTDPRGPASFAELDAFMTVNAHWPWQYDLRRRAERSMPTALTPAQVRGWFADRRPLTGHGWVRLLDAHAATETSAKIQDLARQAWHRAAFTRPDLRRFHQRYRRFLRPADHRQRMDHFLWRGNRTQALRAANYLPRGDRRLADARLKLRRRAGGVDAAIARVPVDLRTDLGLRYERVRWRRRGGKIDDAYEMLAAVPPSDSRGRRWWREKHIVIRDFLNRGKTADAYALAAAHQGQHPTDRAEATWLAGWIALNKRGRADRALVHFETLYNQVTTPISKARAAYWAGHAARRLTADGATWFARAAAHPTTFYGQLAARHGALRTLPLAAATATSNPATRPWRHELATVTRLLAAAGDDELSAIFFRHLARPVSDRAGATRMAALAHHLGRPDLAVFMARKAARRSHHLLNLGYPTALPGLTAATVVAGLEPALVLAIIRQESAFDRGAVSRAGARGLMQLMPATARRVAARAGLPYARARLTEDAAYNLRLGQLYLKDLLAQFGGHYALAIAAYNAGPHRVRRWLRRFGSTPVTEDALVDWIEKIPFGETRNYVQRVLEATVVYRHKLAGETRLAVRAAPKWPRWCVTSCRGVPVSTAAHDP